MTDEAGGQFRSGPPDPGLTGDPLSGPVCWPRGGRRGGPGAGPLPLSAPESGRGARGATPVYTRLHLRPGTAPPARGSPLL